MHVICWNVRTNNEEKIRERCDAMGRTLETAHQRPLNQGLGNLPWMMAILENKSGGNEAGIMLRQRMQGSWHHAAALGGGSHTRENIVLLGGNCSLISAQQFNGWQEGFRQHIQQAKLSAQSAVQQREIHSKLRTTTQNKSVDRFDEEDVWSPANCRNPLLVEVRSNADQRVYRFAFVHAPGPQEGATYTEEYAKIYFREVMGSLASAGLDCLMGDFNVYGSDPHAVDSLRRFGDTSAGTTYNGAGTQGTSVLDRAYVARQYESHSLFGLYDGGPDISDHLGVGVTLNTLAPMVQQAQSSNTPLMLQQATASLSGGSDDMEID